MRRLTLMALSPCSGGYQALPGGARPGSTLSLPACPLPPSTEALFGQPPFASRSFTELEEKIRSNRVIKVGPAASATCCGTGSQRLQVGDLPTPAQTGVWALGTL